MITQSELKKQLKYNESTGIFTWNLTKSGVLIGSIAGCESGGYITIGLFGKPRSAHRLAFLYMTGEIPEQVDHINHKKADNRWGNLRPANNKINQQNKPLSKANKSGFNGVVWSKKSNKWHSNIHIGDKNISLGFFDNIFDAINARKKANKKYGFHKNHGMAI